MVQRFAHLHTHSAFSFLDGASDVAGLVLAAAEHGMPALALTDRDSVTGIVGLMRHCRKTSIKPLGGCDLTLEDGRRLTLLMNGATGWSSLCQILTAAHLSDPNREGIRARWQDLETHHAGLFCLSGGPETGAIPILIRRERYAEAEAFARRCIAVFGRDNFAIEVTRTLTEGEDRLSENLFELADYLGVPAIATNCVRYARKQEVASYEAMCRVRLGITPDEQHADLPFNGERYVKSVSEISAMFRDRPDALEQAALLATRLEEPLHKSQRHLPSFPGTNSREEARDLLSHLVWQGFEQRYRETDRESRRIRLVEELETIHHLGFSDYFLVCADICREARDRRIGYGLRGSAIGSAVAYCLHMSNHDPIQYNVSFERFLSKARAKPPDIDIDFRHDLRDDMMTYVRRTYGEDRVANVANYVSYRGRSLLRDLGKALGYDVPEIDRLRELLWHSKGNDLREKLESQPELRDLGIDIEQHANLFALCAAMAGLPRHLGTHSSGIVVADVPLAQVAPVQWAAKGVTVVALDKDDVEADGIGLLKIDQLSLRALTAVDIAVNRLHQEDDSFDYAGREREDADTLALIRTAQTIGMFQLESPAQMSLQWRLQASRFDDLVASVSLIRPGPIVGNSVEPYIARRHGWLAPRYPLPELEPILKETYGRILFQDQVLDVVRILGGYTHDEADRWLKTMTHVRSTDEMNQLGLELLERAKRKGLTGKRFERVWRQIKGFSRYGFCHGHALAFADHAQGTAWLITHHPAEFFAALLSVEPCGFWSVATVVAEAVRRGARVLGPCINRSLAREWSVQNIDGQKTIRCALRYVRSLHRTADAVAEEHDRRGDFDSVQEVARRCPFLTVENMDWLTLSGAFDMLAPNRRQILWSLPSLCAGARRGKNDRGAVQASGQQALAMEIPPFLTDHLPDFDDATRVRWEWVATGFSPDTHPLSFHRATLAEEGVLRCAELQSAQPGRTVRVAGLVIRPHRPPTPSGQVFVFFTLEDETGLAQVTVPPDVYEQVGADVFNQAALIVEGIAEKRGAGILLRARATEPIAPLFVNL